MITREQLNILGVFRENLFSPLTFREIKERSGQKSNNVTQLAITEFLRQGIVKANKTGSISSYTLNLESSLALAYLNILNEADILRNRKLPLGVLKKIEERISVHTNLFILAVFGSYSGKTGKKPGKDSDLDVAVIAGSGDSVKEIKPYLETVKRRETTKVDYHVFTEQEFLEMLRDREENVGKEIFRKSIIFHGMLEYMRLIGRLEKWRP